MRDDANDDEGCDTRTAESAAATLTLRAAARISSRCIAQVATIWLPSLLAHCQPQTGLLTPVTRASLT